MMVKKYVLMRRIIVEDVCIIIFYILVVFCKLLKFVWFENEKLDSKLFNFLFYVLYYLYIC